MGINTLNLKIVSVVWYLYVLSNMKAATFKAKFIKNLKNTEPELKRAVRYL